MIKVWIIMLVGFGVPEGTAVQIKGDTVEFKTQHECELNKQAFDEYSKANNKRFKDGYLAHACVAVNRKTI